MTATATRPAKGTRFITDTGSEWVVTSVRKGIGSDIVWVHGNPADAYDAGSRTGVYSWKLEDWTAAHGTPARVVAAEAPRDEVTVPVAGFDPALAAAAADAIERSDAQAAADARQRAGDVTRALDNDPNDVDLYNRAQADAALGTVAASPGEFGAALAGLEFGEGQRGDSLSAGPYWSFEHASELFRVVCYTSDGDRVLLLGWDPKRPAAKLEAWRVEFAGTTPQSVIIAAIANATGVLPVSR